MVQAARRGDVVVTTGGIIGKVVKVGGRPRGRARNRSQREGPSRPHGNCGSPRQGRTDQGRAAAGQVAAGQEGRAERLRSPSCGLRTLLDREPDAPFRPLEIGFRSCARGGCRPARHPELHADRRRRLARRPAARIYPHAPDRARPRSPGRRLHADAGRRSLSDQVPGRGPARRRAPEAARRQDRTVRRHRHTGPRRSRSHCGSGRARQGLCAAAVAEPADRRPLGRRQRADPRGHRNRQRRAADADRRRHRRQGAPCGGAVDRGFEPPHQRHGDEGDRRRAAGRQPGADRGAGPSGHDQAQADHRPDRQARLPARRRPGRSAERGRDVADAERRWDDHGAEAHHGRRRGSGRRPAELRPADRRARRDLPLQSARRRRSSAR